MKKFDTLGRRNPWLKRSEKTVEDYIAKRTRREGKCLIWIGGKSGYGHFEYKFNVGIPSRKVYEAMVGPIPKDRFVLHKCDHPRCVNWKGCLYLGTKKDNRRDFMERHPRAKELMRRLIGRGGWTTMWKTMSKRKRKEFIAWRTAIQNEKRIAS